MPILREMTELLFARGFIKVLFCTETMSVGINLPVKTTIFTDITKFNGNVMRTLYSHEYTQAAGRAGRLGLDTVGHVIHLNNLFRNVETINYKAMMNGKPQTLTSKFKISYNLLLNLLDIGDNNLVQFANRSMVTGDLDNQMNQLMVKQSVLNTELQNLKTCLDNLRTPVDTIKQYIDLERNLEFSANKKRKEIERQLVNIRDNYKYYEQDKATYNKFINKEKEKQALIPIQSGDYISKAFEDKHGVALSVFKIVEISPMENTATIVPVYRKSSLISEYIIPTEYKEMVETCMTKLEDSTNVIAYMSTFEKTTM
jgi:superfamily II RNA helicase